MGDDFLQRVETAIKASGLTATAFGREVLGDPTYVFYLREGRESRRQTRERVEDFILKLERQSARKRGRAS